MGEVEVDRRLWARLRRKVRKMADPQDAEDALQTAYLRLHQYRTKQDVRNIEAFILKSTHNILVDVFRRRKIFSDHVLEEKSIEIADPNPLQDELLEFRMHLHHVRAGLERLSPRTRQIFEMHKLDKLKYREIADCLGISQSAVEKHIAKAALFISQWAKDWN